MRRLPYQLLRTGIRFILLNVRHGWYVAIDLVTSANHACKIFPRNDHVADQRKDGATKFDQIGRAIIERMPIFCSIKSEFSPRFGKIR